MGVWDVPLLVLSARLLLLSPTSATSPTEDTTYTPATPACVSTEDDKTFQNSTTALCEYACTLSTRCYGYTFDPDTATCTNRYSFCAISGNCTTGVCFNRKNGCVYPSMRDISYCSGVIAYQVRTDLDTPTQDAIAMKNYNGSRTIWAATNGLTSCAAQEYGKSMCSNCLAIQRRVHCVAALPKCIGGKDRKVCSGLCEDMNRRCNSVYQCTSADYDVENCSPAAKLRASWPCLLAASVVLVLTGRLV